MAMKHQGEAGVRGRSAHAGAPGTRYLLATCGVVATAAYLGAAWLRHPVAGLPAGVWAIGVAQAAGYAWSLRSARRAEQCTTGQPRSALPMAPGVPASAGWAGLDMSLILGRVGAAAWEGAKAVSASFHVPPERVMEIERKAIAWLGRGGSGSRELRIGMDVDSNLMSLLRGGSDPIRVQWVAVGPGGSEQDILRRLRLDALVRQSAHGSLCITTPESEGHEAAWYDWAAPRPLTYGAVFPTRIDPEQITIAELDAADCNEVALIRAVSVAAAGLSRIPSRLSLADRLRGRTPLAGNVGASFVDRSMLALADLLAEPGQPSPVRKAAARAVSAFLAASDSWVAPEVRLRGMHAAMSAIGDEPDALLRAGTVALASEDDVAGFAALSKAAAMIRGRREHETVDHLAFLQAEVECGLPGPLTLGRVAAGVCLVCATSPSERVPFIRADFMDDVRYSAWLVGRDQDRAVLYEAFRVVEKAMTEGTAKQAA